MSFAVLGVILLAICWKFGYWRNWKIYYPTVLYLFSGNLVALHLLRDKPLWEFGQIFARSPMLNICMMVILYPGTVILYLSLYPEAAKPVKQILYMLLCAGIYSATEAISSLFDGFCYYNGWNLLYSVIFNMAMFPLLRLHYKKPLLVWPVSAVLALMLLWWFRIPLAR